MDNEMNGEVRIYTCIHLSVSTPKGNSRIHVKETCLPGQGRKEAGWMGNRTGGRISMCDVAYFLVFKLSDCVIYLKVNKHIFKRFIYLFIRERAW